MWKYSGQLRPDFAQTPKEGQESVWDYPRPPIVVACSATVEVKDKDRIVAKSTRACRVLETASPPTYYIPRQDVDESALVIAPGSSFCEWKGAASYWSLAWDPRGEPIAWSNEDPSAEFAQLRDHVSFYPGRIACYVDGERVRPQPGGFYGGWLTEEIVGPIKGEPGTGSW